MNSRAHRWSAGTILPLAALLGFLVAYYVRVVDWQRLFQQDGYVTGDWLIDYSQGFLRRGLFGEVARLLQHVAGVDPVQFVLEAKSGLYLSLCVLVLVLAVRKGLGAVELVLVLSPWALMFDINLPGGSGRKELLLFVVFALYCVLDNLFPIKETARGSRWRLWYLIASFTVLTLVHEGLFFFLHLFLVFMCLKRVVSAAEVRAFLVSYAVAACVCLVSFVFSGTQVQASGLCAALTAQGLPASLCVGGISSLGGFTVRFHEGYLYIFVPLAVLSFAPLVWYGLAVLDPAVHRRFIAGACLALLVEVPLYSVSADWGRWIHITALLLFFSILSCRVSPLTLRSMSPLVLSLVLITSPMYVVLWRLPHFIAFHRDLSFATNTVGKWSHALFTSDPSIH